MEPLASVKHVLSPNGEDRDLTTSQVLYRFANANFKLSRDLLYFWEKRTWIVPRRIPRDKGQRRYYSQDDVNKIGLLLDAYAAGLTPEKAWDLARRSVHLPGKRLEGLLDAATELGGALGPRQHILDMIAISMEKVMRCESAALLLFDPQGLGNTEGRPRYLKLEANSIRGKLVHEHPTFELNGAPHSGLTGWVASRGEPVNLCGEELRYHVGRREFIPHHLPSKCCYSWFMSPLRDRKQRTLGWVKVENRLSTDANPNDTATFDETDETMVKILAKQIVTTLEVLSVMQVSRDLLDSMNQATSLRKFCEDVLARAIALLGVDRGDFAWAEPNGTLKLLAFQGPIDRPQALDQPMARKSLTRVVFDAKKPDIQNHAPEQKRYLCCWSQTQSEALVPLLTGRKCAGVLNVESRKPDFFDGRDLELLQHLATHIVAAVQMIESREAIRRQMIAPPPQITCQPEAARSEDGTLDAILTSVRQELQFDGGLIYVADHPRGKLLCGAAATSDLKLRLPAYDFNDSAFVAEVFRSGAFRFIEQPNQDLPFDAGTLHRLQVEASMLGVPLLFGHTPVGVLVLWGNADCLRAKARVVMERYAQLAVTTVAIAHREAERKTLTRGLQTVLDLIQKPAPSAAEVLKAILNALIHVGFDRARVFKLERGDTGRAFVCLDSAGREPDGYFKNFQIVFAKSKYAQRTYGQWRNGDLKPRVRHPAKDGADPYASDLGKPHDLPWAVAPLAVGGLFGYLAVDRAVTQEPFTDSDLDTIGVFATLAAHAMASEQLKNGNLSAELPTVGRTALFTHADPASENRPQ
jgi:GAF domain-containing protein/DNA-binding transcriptional MerR regulator